MKWVSGFCLLLTACPIIIVAFFNVKAEVKAANILSLARAIENARAPPVELVENELSQVGAEFSCLDDVSRSVVTLWVYLANSGYSGQANQKDGMDIGKRALAAVEKRIACSPSDGNAWLIRAELLQRLNPASHAVATSLQMSYRLAPADSWIMYPRLDFTLAHFDFVQGALKNEFSADLQILNQYAPPDIVASIYVKANEQVRTMIFQSLATLPEDRRNAVAENADGSDSQ